MLMMIRARNTHHNQRENSKPIYALTLNNGRLRIFRVTCTALPPKLLPPNARTTVSSAAPDPSARFLRSIASLANLKRARSEPIIWHPRNQFPKET